MSIGGECARLSSKKARERANVIEEVSMTRPASHTETRRKENAHENVSRSAAPGPGPGVARRLHRLRADARTHDGRARGLEVGGRALAARRREAGRHRGRSERGGAV